MNLIGVCVVVLISDDYAFHHHINWTIHCFNWGCFDRCWIEDSWMILEWIVVFHFWWLSDLSWGNWADSCRLSFIAILSIIDTFFLQCFSSIILLYSLPLTTIFSLIAPHKSWLNVTVVTRSLVSYFIFLLAPPSFLISFLITILSATMFLTFICLSSLSVTIISWLSLHVI